MVNYMEFIQNLQRDEIHRDVIELIDRQLHEALAIQKLESINDIVKPKAVNVKKFKQFQHFIRIIEVAHWLKGCRYCKNSQRCPSYHYTVISGTEEIYFNDIEYLFIGEAPAKEELYQHRPFVGKAGKTLRQTLDYLFQSRMPYVITNTCFCYHPASDKPKMVELKADINILRLIIRVLRLLSPNFKGIIALGSYATYLLSQQYSNQKKIKLPKVSEYIGLLQQSNIVDPPINYTVAYHPSYINRQHSTVKLDYRAQLANCLKVLDHAANDKIRKEAELQTINNNGEDSDGDKKIYKLLKKILPRKKEGHILVDIYQLDRYKFLLKYRNLETLKIHEEIFTVDGNLVFANNKASFVCDIETTKPGILKEET